MGRVAHRGSDLDPGVQRQQALSVAPQRVDVQRHQFAQVDDHLRNLDQRQRQGVEVGPAQQAVAQPLVNPRLRHDLAGQVQVQRRQAIGQVVNGDRVRAALAEVDHRPKLPAGAHPQGQFIRAVAGGHRLQDEAMATGRRGDVMQSRQPVRRRLPHGVGGTQDTGHAAEQRRMGDFGGEDFQATSGPRCSAAMAAASSGEDARQVSITGRP